VYDKMRILDEWMVAWGSFVMGFVVHEDLR